MAIDQLDYWAQEAKGRMIDIHFTMAVTLAIRDGLVTVDTRREYTNEQFVRAWGVKWENLPKIVRIHTTRSGDIPMDSPEADLIHSVLKKEGIYS